jgi:SPP1 family predicted phage head-tail adaptor
MAIRSGKLRHSISIQQITEARTGTGSIEPTWAEFVALRAAVKWISGGESNSNQVNASNSVEFKTRYTAGITQKMRVSYNSRLFDIQSANVLDDRNHEMLITAVEHVE